MTISQQTTSPFDTTREVGPDACTEAVSTIQSTSSSLSDDSLVGENGSKGGTIEIILPPKRTHPPFIYPVWPISKPRPQTTSPHAGQHPHPACTQPAGDISSAQERGIPRVPPLRQIMRKNRTGTSLPEGSFQEGVSEAEATALWRAAGNTSDKEALAQWRESGSMQE